MTTNANGEIWKEKLIPSMDLAMIYATRTRVTLKRSSIILMGSVS